MIEVYWRINFKKRVKISNDYNYNNIINYIYKFINNLIFIIILDKLVFIL